MKRRAGIVLGIWAGLCLAGCALADPREQQEQVNFFGMDTYMTITAYGENADEALEKARERILELEGGVLTGYQGNYGGAQSGSSEDAELHAAANFLNNMRYQEAMRVLNNISRHNAQWYYLHAVANAGLGNNISAVQDAQTAVNMEPNNMQYRQLLSQLQGGGQWYTDMGEGYGYERTGTDMGKWCCECLAINALCNCCCYGGRGFYCC